jgi:FkbM family methyltransferase
MMQLFARLHRAQMTLLQRIGSEALFNFYRRVLIRLGRYRDMETSFGGRFHCDLRDRVPAFLFCFGQWEPNITAWISRRLQPGDVFVDVGANIGYYTVLAASAVGAGGAVVAIDASPSLFAQLNRTLVANGCTQVRAVNAAVSAAPGVATVYAGPAGNAGSASLLPHWRNGRPEAEVPCYPLSQILTVAELARVRLIKIDVEGSELPILRQLIATLDLYPPNLEFLVECSTDGNSEEWNEILGGLKQRGFSAFAIENAYSVSWYLRWRQASPPRRINALPPGQTDVLFTRDPASSAW